jgi:hypothetical protein
MAIQRKDKERDIASAFEVQGFDFMMRGSVRMEMDGINRTAPEGIVLAKVSTNLPAVEVGLNF